MTDTATIDIRTPNRSSILIQQDSMTENGYRGVSFRQSNHTYWTNRKLKPAANGFFVCCCYTLSLVIGGLFHGFNEGYDSGVGGFVIAYVIVTFGFICLSFCVAELASAMPFCGGGYGYTRQTMGKTMGVLVGIIECIEYISIQIINLYLIEQIFLSIRSFKVVKFR
jgi:amino acid transporter